MFFEPKREDLVELTEKKLKELELEHERLIQKTEKYFQELDLTAYEVSTYLNNPQNFTPEAWETLKACQKKLSEKLERELKHVPNPKKSKNSYSSLNLPSYALFVK